jgi:hypothetical protein
MATVRVQPTKELSFVNKVFSATESDEEESLGNPSKKCESDVKIHPKI